MRTSGTVRVLTNCPVKRRVLFAAFSVLPTPENKEPEKGSLKAPTDSDNNKRIFGSGYFRELFSDNKNGLIAAGSIITAVGVSSLLYGVGENLPNLFSASALYYGMSVGATATAINVAERSFRVEPEVAVSLAMAELKKNKDLQNILGHKITAGDVRTYATSSSGFGIIGAVPRLIHPQVQVVFNLAGSTSPAVVSAVCTKKGLFSKHCEYVGVDWTNPTGATITLTLVGDEGKFTMKAAIKEHAKLLAAKSTKFRP